MVCYEALLFVLTVLCRNEITKRCSILSNNEPEYAPYSAFDNADLETFRCVIDFMMFFPPALLIVY